MLKPRESERPVEDELGAEHGMEDILRSIQNILGDDPAGEVRFPEPEAGANDARAPVSGGAAADPNEAPLAFLRRKRVPETVENIAPAPSMPSLDERLARHRAKADAERNALRELAERASARVTAAAGVSIEARPENGDATQAPDQTLVPDEFDIFAESEDLTAPPAPSRPRARRIKLPDIEAEPVDYAPSPSAKRERDADIEAGAIDATGTTTAEYEVVQPTTVEQAGVEETFEDIARAMLTDRATDMDAVLADMMRPLVREWLQDNLSGVVERVVREEIERVSRGGR